VQWIFYAVKANFRHEGVPMPMTGSHLPKPHVRTNADSVEAAGRERKTRKARMPRWPSYRRRFRNGPAKSA
jgi:hypothetical protein